MGARGCRRAVLLLAACLSACGGGGGGDGAEARAVLPALAQDSAPPAPRRDVRPLDYYPAHLGDSWVLRGISDPTAVLTRRVTDFDGERFTLQATERDGDVLRRYRRTADGLVRVGPLGSASPAVMQQALPEWLELPEQLTAVGEVRELLRQGPLDADIDDDGHVDSFRLVIRQTLVGDEDVGVAGLEGVPAMHLSTVVRTEYHPSSPRATVTTVVSTEDSWWLPGLGLARWRAETTDGNGRVVSPVQDYRLASAWIDGRAALPAR